MSRGRIKRIGSRRGLSTVEMALIMPLVLLMVLGILEYGWLFSKAADVNNACRVGARTGSLGGKATADVEAAVLAAMTAAGLQDSEYTLTLDPADPSTLSSGQALTVTLSIPYANISVVNSALIPTPTNLSSTVVMAREGP